MSNEVTIASLPQTFRETLREKVMAATLDLIPKEVLDGYINKEIIAFFETDQLLTVKETEVVLDNPNFDKNRNSGYNNERQTKFTALAFGSKMTPFRQLVWSTLYEKLRPELIAMLNDESSEVGKELEAWMEKEVKPDMAETNRSTFTNLAAIMSRSMFQGVLHEAVNVTYQNMRMALQNMGMNTHQIPERPFVPPQRPY